MAQENPIRLLTQEEQESYSTAVVYGIIIIPAFRDAVALLRPFYDGGAKTAYTDRFARVGLSPWFFSLNIYQRASVILHETMHVLNNHFAREDALSADPKLGNICGDFEINCGLDMLPKVDLSVGIFPDKNPYSYKRYLSLEQYYHLLKEDINQGDTVMELTLIVLSMEKIRTILPTLLNQHNHKRHLQQHLKPLQSHHPLTLGQIFQN